MAASAFIYSGFDNCLTVHAGYFLCFCYCLLAFFKKGFQEHYKERVKPAIIKLCCHLTSVGICWHKRDRH